MDDTSSAVSSWMVTRRAASFGLFTVPLLGAHIGHRGRPAPDRLIIAARSQIGQTLHYDPSYVPIDYPGGDIPTLTGVCTDVVIRAFRAAFSFDFQLAVHEDMGRAFETYPSSWGLTRRDPNIDHRRVPNLEVFLARRGAEASNLIWQPGDVFTGRLPPSNLPHIAIVSDRRSPRSGNLLLIHNIGRGTEESDWLDGFNAHRRFRFFPGIDSLN